MEKTELTELAEALTQEMIAAYRMLKEANPVPFMQESISEGEYRRRWRAMTVSQRQAEFERLGIDKLKELLNA